MNKNNKHNNIKKGILFAIFTCLLGGCTKQKGMSGLWYEQKDSYTNSIIIDSKHITVTTWNGNSEVYTYKTENKDGMVYLLNTEDEEFGFSIFYEIYYDAKTDTLYARDFPYMDGDGGYHLYTFKKTKYVAPPPPVYGERIDNSDPDAVKTIESKDIVSIDAEFYYIDTKDYGDMAPDWMRTDLYSYHLEKTDENVYHLSSNFCEVDIDVAQKLVQQIQDLMDEINLAAINGIDIHTEEMPYDTPVYTMTVKYASDEEIRSSANGNDIPTQWKSFEEPFNRILFDAFVDAGYNPSTNEFHTSSALKRPGSGEPSDLNIEVLSGRFEKQIDKAEFKPYVSYSQFDTKNIENKQLAETLEGFNERILQQAKETFEKSSADFEAYINRTKKYKRDDSWMMHGHYLEKRYSDSYFFGFFINEFHAYCDDSLGTRVNNNTWCMIDIRSGKEISLADLFNSPEDAYEVMEKRIQEEYGIGTWYDKMDKDVFHENMMKAITTKPSEGGIGFHITYNNLTVYLNELATGQSEWVPTVNIYYDSCQDQLNDAYCTLR